MAADLPAPARAACAAWRDSAARPALRPVGDDALHITLSFLGEASPDGLPALLAPCVAPVAALSLGAGRWLPPRRPRVLVVEVEDSTGALGALRARVAAALGDSERRRYLPHVTVARVRARVGEAALPPAPGTRFAPTALTLYRSHLGRGPARYEALWSAKLSD